MRKCKICGRELPEDQFMKSKLGVTYVCKECVRKRKADTKEENKKIIAQATEKSLEEAKNLRLSDFTPRELLTELKKRGYMWKEMKIVVEQYVDWNKI